jgi:hypothetical protein
MMDIERFDLIARTFATSSRRRMLGVLAVGALVPLLPRRAGAACQDGTIIQFECGTRECIGGEFVNTFDEGNECRPAQGECDAPAVCIDGSFACPPNRNLPNGTPCTDDGNICTADVCQGGQCVHRPNSVPCADDGNVCTADVCANGTCTHPPHPNGTSCPGGACCVGQCFDLQTDENNCGVCGKICGSGRTCCKGKCRKLKSDKRNCGQCGKRCGRGKRCLDGQCR